MQLWRNNVSGPIAELGPNGTVVRVFQTAKGYPLATGAMVEQLKASLEWMLTSPSETALADLWVLDGKRKVSLREFLTPEPVKPHGLAGKDTEALKSSSMRGRIGEHRKPKPRVLSDEQLAEARRLRADGKSLRNVAKWLGVNHGTLSWALKNRPLEEGQTA